MSEEMIVYDWDDEITSDGGDMTESVVLPEGVYNWLAYNLSSFGTCVLLATTIVTVILYLCLCRKETKTAGEAPAA